MQFIRMLITQSATCCVCKSHPVRFHVTSVNSALHPSGVTKSSTCFSWGQGGIHTSDGR